MKKFTIFSTMIAAVAVATPAMAQEESSGPEVYIGATAGYHFLGDNPLNVGQPVPFDNDAIIYGGYIGVDVPVSSNVVVGVEGNFNLGTNAIDSEYGGTVKLGYNIGDGTQVFLRGGYQQIDIDTLSATGISEEMLEAAAVASGTVFDDTEGDYLLGIGAQIKADDNYRIRFTVDTLAFDTVRTAIGIQYNF